MQIMLVVRARAGDPSSKKIYMEDEAYCKKFKNFLPADEERVMDLVQFWSDPGGLRTVEARSIIGTSRRPVRK